MRILIVDDDATNRELLGLILESKGYTTEKASDGLEALELLDREPIDAIISDVLMPRLDGYQLCYGVRASPRFFAIPFIFYTATYTAPSDEKLSLELGADKFIRKPASSAVINDALLEVLAKVKRSAPQRTMPIEELALMKQYSARLVAKLEEKNIELEQRTKLAALSADVGAALTHGNTLREILQRCSEAFVQHLDAAFARIWTHNEGEKMLELQASAGIYTHINGPHGRVRVGKFKIGLIAEERKPHLTNSVIGDPRVPEQEWARRERLVAFAGYPLVIGDHLVGVMAMFARQPISVATLDAMASIADSVALGINRAQADEELCRTHEQLRRLVAHSPAVLYTLKVEARNLTPVVGSDNIERLLGVTPESASFEWWRENLHPEDRDRVLSTLARAMEEGGYLMEYRIRHRDGTYRWVEDTNRIVRDAGGQAQEIVGVWTDITERKRSAAELEELQKQLRESARRMGIAEMARTVVHNLGNVLNSVSVSTTLVADKIRRSRVLSLPKVAGLLQEHKSDLAVFLANDAKGSQLPGYLSKLGEHLMGEQVELLGELKLIIEKVEHMGQIIATQQNRAQTSGHSEVLPAAELIESALRLNAAALEAQNVQIVREFSAVPLVLTEKHKVLQILVNLLTNAIQAMDKTERHNRLLAIQIGLNGKQGVRISVADNGMGIVPENLSRIFELGFTTRKAGHGLGLQGSALLAGELGGTLSVESKGLGQGAIFTLELPFRNHPASS